MPGVDGFELLRRVRGSMLPRLREMPFAVLSGADDPVQRARALELGADRFAVKGQGTDALIEWLSERLATPGGTVGTGDEVPEPPGSDSPTAPAAPAAPRPPASPMPRLVADPLPRWFQAAVGRPAAAGDVAHALLRLHAPGIDDLAARLRRGIRSADALHVEAVDMAWLCVPATGPLALRLALRFGLLAAGRQAVPGPAAARVSVCLHPVDPREPMAALSSVGAISPDAPDAGGLALHACAGSWGSAWRCVVPWPGVRMMAG
jgi:CheY-like chemotaxis protein